MKVFKWSVGRGQWTYSGSLVDRGQCTVDLEWIFSRRWIEDFILATNGLKIEILVAFFGFQVFLKAFDHFEHFKKHYPGLLIFFPTYIRSS